MIENRVVRRNEERDKVFLCGFFLGLMFSLPS